MLSFNFFNRDSLVVAQSLIGKIIYHKYNHQWLSAQIIETEAYYKSEKASHSSLGYTEKRKALFMPAGTIYMYYARGGDSLCISTEGKGNAVLIKSAIINPDEKDNFEMIKLMQKLNPVKGSDKIRVPDKLCSGQTLLCRSLNLKVREWDGYQFDINSFYLDDSTYHPEILIQTTRLGLREKRDAHLPYRFIDKKYSDRSTSNVLKQRGKVEGENFQFIEKN